MKIDLTSLSELLARYFGLDFPDWTTSRKVSALRPRIRVLSKELKVQEPSELLKRLARAQPNDEIWSALIDQIRINRTELFRHPSDFATFKARVLPALRGRKGLRILSAGCSTGLEAYSLGILLEDDPDWREKYSILGIDINRIALSLAGLGIFRQKEIHKAGSYQRLVKRHSKPQGSNSSWRAISPAILRRIRWKRENLLFLKNSRIGKFDVIFCRNVLCYLSSPHQKKVLRQLAEVCRPGGYLFATHVNSPGPQWVSVTTGLYRRVSR